ncbi:MurT ligase domain-containing protein [Corynebacterium lactis]|uniref:Lipid II isoglutaminyl synthase (glutamine-hydrolyzing) subunit MurT n=1 Tax=Corynebacterium lactis RW2-5 TaxID=1408189 RepID=A0A0K2GYG1_9CORY|nr:MurT ligase domain-containing protein [Corynebacterium lactis]ALA66516.1 UDP-N-acetylmuramyl peptide synthase [Corynebacterium lactis RW2-5]
MDQGTSRTPGGLIARLRATLATTAAKGATWASRASGRGAGGMIGGLIAQKIDPRIMASLGKGRPAAIITGTNGKSTTTRMFAAAMRAAGHTVATNEGGDNMDAGVISALLATPNADSLVLEVDELHVAHIAADLKPKVIVLLNLSRDQLDRVGEINKIEGSLRAAVDANPQATIIANCDDPLITSAAWDAKNVVWVSAGGGWTNDATSSPRTGGPIIHDGEHWYAVKPLADGSRFERPTPSWRISDEGVATPFGVTHPLNLTLPGNANRGNATLAIAGAVEMGADATDALAATEKVDNVAGRYSTVVVRDSRGAEKHVRMLLAKNPAGWQEALSMVDRTADAVVIAVNGHVADGEDLSWLWDVRFEDFDGMDVIAAGERGTDLAVRLLYASIDAELIANPLDAIKATASRGAEDPSASTRVEVLANYTAFRDLKRDIERVQEDK